MQWVHCLEKIARYLMAMMIENVFFPIEENGLFTLNPLEIFVTVSIRMLFFRTLTLSIVIFDFRIP